MEHNNFYVSLHLDIGAGVPMRHTLLNELLFKLVVLRRWVDARDRVWRFSDRDRLFVESSNRWVVGDRLSFARHLQVFNVPSPQALLNRSAVLPQSNLPLDENARIQERMMRWQLEAVRGEAKADVLLLGVGNIEEHQDRPQIETATNKIW
ncbi:unnamed protein product, partial [Amoebophrya sp. A120]|eukprot:GSA120T00012262001.1